MPHIPSSTSSWPILVEITIAKRKGETIEEPNSHPKHLSLLVQMSLMRSVEHIARDTAISKPGCAAAGRAGFQNPAAFCLTLLPPRVSSCMPARMEEVPIFCIVAQRLKRYRRLIRRRKLVAHSQQFLPPAPSLSKVSSAQLVDEGMCLMMCFVVLCCVLLALSRLELEFIHSGLRDNRICPARKVRPCLRGNGLWRIVWIVHCALQSAFAKMVKDERLFIRQRLGTRSHGMNPKPPY